MLKAKFFISKISELWYIVSRNVFILFNGIVATVVILLVAFGETKNGIFIGIILIVNIILGLFQDIRAWVTLQKLQLLTTPHVIRINTDGTEDLVTSEEIKKGDKIKLKIGSQVPCDSLVLDSNSFEINEGLITGESNSLPRSVGEHILSGSIVTAGSATISIESIFKESRIARMTEGVQKYSVNTSPIQRAVDKSVRVSLYVLLIAVAFVLIKGLLGHSSAIYLVNSLGTLTGILVPQGLVFAVTLFFAYGAVHLYNRQVLLQEVNATEKLGRIKNLCMDKTGTLTENELTMESMLTPKGISREEAEGLVSAYISGTIDTSDITKAIKKMLTTEHTGEIKENLAFSSWRRYGAVCLREIDNDQDTVVCLGLPDIFVPHLSSNEERKWLNSIIENNAKQGKRVLCAVKSYDVSKLDTLSDKDLSVVACFIFHNKLREGILESVGFFQKRGVKIKIISGDNPVTTSHIAASAGVNDSDKLVTGKEMEKWDSSEFEEKVSSYAIFAGVMPEQKEKIVSAMKKNGFTAMVGDGANDALAIKAADLGIAMFDGSPATRQLASVVLMNNSFTVLPGGVELADNIIKNIEIFSSVFFNQVFIGLFFFTTISILGYNYPFTPLNVTFMNYFAVGIPGILLSFWTLYPSDKVNPTDNRSFLKRVLPFTVISAIFQAIGTTIIFLTSPRYLLDASSNTLAVLSFIILGFVFFAFAPAVYRETLAMKQKIQVLFFALFEIVLIILAFHIPFAMTFFNITPLYLTTYEWIVFSSCIIVFSVVQYFVAKRFLPENKHPWLEKILSKF
jgi:cation-transporting ATPase E